MLLRKTTVSVLTLWQPLAASLVTVFTFFEKRQVTPSMARGGQRNPFDGQGWPAKPLRWPAKPQDFNPMNKGRANKPPLSCSTNHSASFSLFPSRKSFQKMFMGCTTKWIEENRGSFQWSPSKSVRSLPRPPQQSYYIELH